jgi:hypothetical protein
MILLLGRGPPREWLNLECLTQIEVTSEDAGHPIESALVHAGDQGWRAEGPGEQTIRLLFDEPVKLRRVRLVFREEVQGRTQEFVLRWSPDGGRTYREIVRQQYIFSPPRHRLGDRGVCRGPRRGDGT